MKKRKKQELKISLNNFRECKPPFHRVYHDLDFISNFRMGYEYYKPLYPCYSISSFPHTFNLYLIPFSNLNWSFHLSSSISSKSPLSTFSTIHLQHIHSTLDKTLRRVPCPALLIG
ncbi:115aa long hypothetical protein [Pyrococcus horikoshii OT3]|uniref:Uncharacterized protein n=1 Tax=Pyrococcus horikoshii (strain ATCC 700860 / DSM 12428 / JCM 9974 / NBRC 100139 / OT-3) TaxID=70601 RepID=O58833_PYRHO|nr:115aa long hypothetical protein [Pyrococcus horikoshii OT3]